MHTAYIALGSNLGDRRANLAAAIAALASADGIKVVRVATLVETAPFDCPPGSPAFLNAAATLATSLEPDALLNKLHAIERTLGRERHIRHCPRTIDLDLLLFGDRVVSSETLTLPHPRLHERRFVLAPLAEIASDVVHPRFRKSIAKLLADLNRMRAHS